uniref:BTB domain-containing protein n=1 Tax=Panagrolaimus sp. ES5 TaxID=591445 RepID=A0AC34FKR6_9BILA
MDVPHFTMLPLHESNRQTLGNIFWIRDDKDFTFIVGKAEIRIHKVILAARSSFFAEMFTIIDSAENQIENTDFDADVVQAAVEFCYDQNITEFFKNTENSCSLFQFADKYDIADLKEILERCLVTKLLPQDIY